MYNRVRRSIGRDAKLFGVCGGLSKYISPEADPLIMRLIWVFLGIFSGVAPVLIVYLILASVLRKEIPKEIEDPADSDVEKINFNLEV